MGASDGGDLWALDQRKLDSCLIEITATILKLKDEDGTPLVENILNVTGQKGTRRWTVEAALEQGVTLTLISEAVFARSPSALKDEHVSASKVLRGPETDVGKLDAAKITPYGQGGEGYMLMRAATDSYSWALTTAA